MCPGTAQPQPGTALSGSFPAPENHKQGQGWEQAEQGVAQRCEGCMGLVLGFGFPPRDFSGDLAEPLPCLCLVFLWIIRELQSGPSHQH